MKRLKEGGGGGGGEAPLPHTLLPIFCSCLIFLAGKTPTTPFFALCFTETLATQAIVWYVIGSGVPSEVNPS